MNSMYLLEGAVIGFSLAAPIGPVGILCVRRTLAHGARRGLAIGASAACCDMVNSIVAAFGITLVSDFITLEQSWIRLVGGIILLVIGYGVFRARPLADKEAKAPRGHAWDFFSTALLVFTNPLTLFAFAAAFAVIGVKNIVGHPAAGLMLVAGVFFGSLTWFVLLAGLVHFFKEKVMRVGLTLVNRVTGSLLMLCGLYALWSGIRGLYGGL
jgi:threonine/homoserine/homoserine lactone efflux protein